MCVCVHLSIQRRHFATQRDSKHIFWQRSSHAQFVPIGPTVQRVAAAVATATISSSSTRAKVNNKTRKSNCDYRADISIPFKER